MAGQFDGNVQVNGNLSVTGNKAFVQAHPTDPEREIVYVALEGGEAGTYVRGSGQLQSGKAVLALPEHFGLVTATQGLTVQLTPRGEWLQLYVVELDTAQLVVREAQGKSGAFDYLIQGVRRGSEPHEVIRANLHRAPMYSGQIKATGPRYCPSIEDKVVRFADKERHQIFVEPEGLEHPWLYMNGISTSLPADVQDAVVSSLPGFENAVIARYGYAVEYDFVNPEQLEPTLQVRGVEGLRVIDASVFAEQPAGNTAAPTMALAWRAADLLQRDC